MRIYSLLAIFLSTAMLGCGRSGVNFAGGSSEASQAVSEEDNSIEQEDAEAVGDVLNDVGDNLFDDLSGLLNGGWNIDDNSNITIPCLRGGTITISAEVDATSKTGFLAYSAEITSGSGTVKYNSCKIPGKNGTITLNGTVTLVSLNSSIDTSFTLSGGNYASDFALEVMGSLEITKGTDVTTCRVEIDRQATHVGQFVTSPWGISTSINSHVKAKICDMNVDRNFSYNL